MSVAICKNKPLLLDYTLGIGGEAISWNFGQMLRHELNTLSQYSGLDVFEYGALRRNLLGPNCAAYNTTTLPPDIGRQTRQLYALLMDEDNLPDLEKLPVCSEKTTDIVRVFVSAKKLKVQLGYVNTLTAKGYKVAILVDEVTQYDDNDLRHLLKQVSATAPWACYLFDTSGLLSLKRLQKVFALFEECLEEKVYIGFHGHNNRQLIKDLAAWLLTTEFKHTLCIDGKTSGTGADDLHLHISDLAKMANQSCDTHYDLSVLLCQNDYLQDSAHKMNYTVKLLYEAAAKNHCDAQYVEYYNGLNMGISKQLAAYAELAKKKPVSFDKKTANDALIKGQEKDLNMAFVVLTENSPEAMEHYLSTASQDALAYGVEIYVLDASEDTRTQAVILNYTVDGMSNIHYQRLSPEEKAGKPELNDVMLRKACLENGNYDFVGFGSDSMAPMVSGFYLDLLLCIRNGSECVVVETQHRNNGRCYVRDYKDNLRFFEENSLRLSLTGMVFLNRALISAMLTEKVDVKKNRGFWFAAALLRALNQRKASSSLVVTDALHFDRIEFYQRYVNGDMMEKWLYCWYDMVQNLPADYEPYKAASVRVDMPDFYPFHMKNLLLLREKGTYNRKIFWEYRERLLQISDTPNWKLRMASGMPKWLARGVLKLSKNIDRHPDSILAAFSRKLYKVYKKLG